MYYYKHYLRVRMRAYVPFVLSFHKYIVVFSPVAMHRHVLLVYNNKEAKFQDFFCPSIFWFVSL
jgi:hypothetical protein